MLVFRNLLRASKLRIAGLGPPREGRVTMRSKRRGILRRGRMQSRRHQMG